MERGTINLRLRAGVYVDDILKVVCNTKFSLENYSNEKRITNLFRQHGN